MKRYALLDCTPLVRVIQAGHDLPEQGARQILYEIGSWLGSASKARHIGILGRVCLRVAGDVLIKESGRECVTHRDCVARDDD